MKTYFLPFLLFTAICAAAPLRNTLPLNGEWKLTQSQSEQPPANLATGEIVSVPQVNYGKADQGSRFSWYHRGVDIPADWAGTRIFLNLAGARFAPRVYINGKQVEKCPGGWTPNLVELTAVAKPGSHITLDIACQDWSATFAAGTEIPKSYKGDLRRAKELRGKILSPIGGAWYFFGIWDDVELLARPRNFIDDVAIDTSIRKQRLTVSGKINGTATGKKLSLRVCDGEKEVLRAPARALDATGNWSVSLPFANLKLWSPESPNLYRLEVSLLNESGETVDRQQQPFGFRELWTEGFDFVFNGVKRHLLASSGWPAKKNQSRDEIRQAIRNLKTANCVAFRLHTQPWQRRWLDIADEEGLMIIEEGALWCDSAGLYAYENPLFWKNVKQHLERMVRRDRNHPSLVMWSIENEILHCGAERYDEKVVDKLADTGAFVKALDPTHLITFEADLDPGGAADVIGLHYPHELPKVADYPNTADWMDRETIAGTEGGLLGSRHKRFHWKKDKPLYIGEYLWVPSGDYAPGTVFHGDQAFTDRAHYNKLSKAEAWRYQTQAYRRAGVSGFCPWTFAGSGGLTTPDDPLYIAQKQLYEPVAAFPRNHDNHFFANKKIKRSFDVFNDSTESLELQLNVNLGHLVAQSETFTLPPAGHREITLDFTTPNFNVIRTVALKTALLANGRECHKTTRNLKIYPSFPVMPPPGTQLVLIRPPNTPSFPIPGREIRDWNAVRSLVPERHVLIVAPNAFRKQETTAGSGVKIGAPHPEASALRDFLSRGGRVLVLEQETLAGLPFGVSLTNHASTITFPNTSDPIITRGTTPEIFKFWNGDHYVSKREIRRPTTSGARTLIVSGGENQLDQGPVVEVRVGKGKAILSQLLIGEKYRNEPAARLLLSNLLAYLASHPVPNPRPVLFLGDPDSEFAAKLDQLGVLTTTDTSDTDGRLAILNGGGDWKKILERFTASGRAKTIYWQNPDPKTFIELQSVFGLFEYEIAPQMGPLLVENKEEPLLDGISREEFAYVGPQPVSWKQVVKLDSEIISGTLVPSPRPDNQTWILDPSRMKATTGQIETDKKTQAVRFSPGTKIRALLPVSEAGHRRLAITASGSPKNGEAPKVELSLNGNVVATFSINDKEFRTYTALVQVPEGDVELEASFVNGNAQRQLQVRQITLDKKTRNHRGTRSPLSPAALVIHEKPAGCRLVVDTIRWDKAPGRNHKQAMRYASALLANLGASFQAPSAPPDWVGADNFKPVKPIPYFKVNNGTAHLFAGGSLSTTFDCVAPGDYQIVVNGYSQPAAGTYAIVRIAVDGKTMKETEITSPGSAIFPVGNLSISAGKHSIVIDYINDAVIDKEDRNFHLKAVGFRPVRN